MKSYLIKLAKKSLALCLTVLMLMSCWVFVAPEKAEAAAGSYYYEVRVTVAEGGAKTSTNAVSLYGRANNGTATSETTIQYNVSKPNAWQQGGTVTLLSGTTNVFPTRAALSVTMTGGGCDNGAVGLSYFQIWVGKDASSLVNVTTSDVGHDNEESYSIENSASADMYPYISGGESMAATTLDCPAVGSTNTNKTTAVIPQFYDQYGVNWTGSVDPTYHISKSENGDDMGSGEAVGFWAAKDGSKGYVNINAKMQENFMAEDDGKNDYYMVAVVNNSKGNSVKANQKITVSYNKYTVNVVGKGSVSNLDYTLGLVGGGTTKETWTQEGYYGKSLVNMPDGTGSAAGYTFKGIWTKPQPTTGNASYNAFEADFVTPISSEKFDEYEKAGGTVNGDFITYKDVLYYNAGTEWSTSVKTITGSVDYYGWWLSKDITIKFYDIDGEFLGEKPVKYGWTQSAIEWPTPTEKIYTSGAFEYKDFNGIWEATDGTEINQKACTFTKDLILTPKYETVDFTANYTVNFKDANTGNNLNGSADYSYRTDLGAKGVIPADQGVPNAIRNDLQYSYTFEGWSSQTPVSGNYHILLEDGDFDTAGNAIAINSDWIVRSAVTYYPVYRRHVRTYAVNFWFKDSTGTEISRKVSVQYGATLSAPTDYVPYTYAQEGYGYTFDKWTYVNASSETADFGYSGSLVFTKENLALGLGNVDDGENVTPVNIRAEYGEPVATPYTVTFNYKNDKGEDQKYTAEVIHGKFITSDTVSALVPADEYDDGEALVHFTGNWKVTEGAADKQEYATGELTSFSPTSHVTFEAVYGNPQPFYTVTYIDGANTFSERVLVGSNLPVWTTKVMNDNETPDNAEDDFEEDVEYLPAMADTAQGYYTFQGWYDEKQTDTSYAAMNGNKYDATSTVSGNLTLYPQFKFSPFTYTIKFMSYDGKTQLAAGQFEYGQNMEMLTAEANKAAQSRAQDDTYTYSFIGWDKTVPTFCEGEDMTFIALYKPVYRYYEAKWYNSVLDGDGNWAADKSTKTEDDKTVETALLATTNHTYNSKVYNPSVTVTCTVTPPAGQNYVFAGWYYNDADGNAQPYVRGMLITAEMEFYATYTLTAKTYTVTTDVKGKTAEYKVADGETADAIPEPNAGWVDATKHDEFAGWVTKDEDGVETAFDIATATITADITIYAKFTESEHDYDNEELVTAPTYYKTGEMKKWCSCDAKRTETKAEIAMLTDKVAPTGTIYLGTQGKWSSTDEQGAAATDDNPVTLYANANTDLILTINDTGDVNALYNPSGIGKGIAVIQGFISKGVYSQDNKNVEMSEIVTIFEDETENLNNTENYVVKLGEYGDLEEGATYVAYYYVRDKAGKVLDTKVRTAKFIYDNTVPVFTIEGDNNADKVAGTPTYCETATITAIEDGATLTVNGVAVANDAIDWKSVDGVTTGTYEITQAGNYLVTVTDKAGNKTSKKFQLNDDHSYDVKEVHSTCTEDGYKTEICIVCGDEKDKVDYKSIGHVWTTSMIPATCTESGYTYKVCSECGEEEKIYEVDGEPIAPALGHNYDKVDGEIVYTVVTAATCKTKGKEIATCKDCDETTSREIAIDADAHNWGSVKTLKATCTEDGKTYKTCKLCYISKDVSVIPATGHVETQWIETTAATCGTAGVETLQCKKCKTLIGDYDKVWLIIDDPDDIDTTKYEPVLDEDGNIVSEYCESNDGTVSYTQYLCYVLTDGETVFTYETREIPATGRHILAVSEDPTKTYEATADKEGQITRYCTQCGQEWAEKVAKIEKYTVKFVDEDGETEIKTISDVVSGTTIEKTAVTEPTKANSADGKYKYTFAGWKDAKGNAVTLPIDVTADITLKATYSESTIIYTHQFMVPNVWTSTLASNASNYEEFATMMGAMGDSRVPVAEPTFSLADEEEDAELKKLYTFKFLGWSTTGAVGDIATDFTIAGDATFYAVFEAEAVAYQVIYYNGAQYVWDTTVDGGESVTFGGTTPTKAYDNENHYAFDKWYTDATLKTAYNGEAITALTRLYAGFKATAHTWTKDADSEENSAANCTDAAKVAYECACGATKVESEGKALGHTLADAVTEEVDGVIYSVVYCSVCDAEISRTKTSVTVAFKNHNGVRLETQNLNIGDAIVYGGEVPTKANDAQNTYTFAGWFVEGDTEKTVVELGTASADVVYVAKFTATVRTFRVTYVDADNNTIETTEGIEYGETVPAFEGTEPTKAYDDTYHYTFKEWSVKEGSEVTSDIVIKPVFNEIKHDYDEGVASDPTCTKPGGYLYTCACGHYYTNGTIARLPHDFKQVERVEPDYANSKDGYIKYECTVCGEPKTETLSSALIEVKVTVKDTNGAARSGVKVDLYVYGTDTLVGTQSTDGNGDARFYVKPGDYQARVEGKQTNISVDEDRVVTGGAVTVEPEVQAPACTCSCHKTSFWGILFRLFHKFIKLFTGKYICCDCPSELY